jgi:hypothetical protein
LKAVNEITADIRADMKMYFKYWLHSLFQKGCDHIKLKPRPHVQNYADAQIYAAGDIKACFVLQYTITNLIAGFKFPYNRKALIYFVMEHRNMSIFESDEVQNFCERLVTSTIGEFMSNFRARFGPILISGCKWEIQRFKSMKKHIVSSSTTVPLPAHLSKPPCENLQYNAALPLQSNPAYNTMVARYVQDWPSFPPVP